MFTNFVTHKKIYCIVAIPQIDRTGFYQFAFDLLFSCHHKLQQCLAEKCLPIKTPDTKIHTV
jgi:hypothetical protein